MKKFTQLNESNEYDNFLNLPPVESLGDGVYEGALWGHCFAYNGKKYQCKEGLLNIFPNMVKITIKDGNLVVPFTPIDKFQRPELKNLFD